MNNIYSTLQFGVASDQNPSTVCWLSVDFDKKCPICHKQGKFSELQIWPLLATQFLELQGWIVSHFEFLKDINGRVSS